MAAARLPNRPELRLGFVPLLDAAPLLLAYELGYFADEGLAVTLDRQIGWGNVRDKLVYGQLHASHALVGMPPVSVLGRERFAEPVVAVAALGTGGSAITLGRRLTAAGVNSAGRLAEWLGGRGRREDRPLLAHVFGCSTHHYLLRAWLAAGGVDPDRDVRLCVLPPSQMAAQMAAGHLDGFCAGEPWNTAAEQADAGRIVAATTDVVPDHPEKVLAVNRRWLARHADAAVALVRAILRGCAFCHAPGNADRVAAVLARPANLDMPAPLLTAALAGAAGRRPPAIKKCDPAGTFPSATHAAWLLSEMIRWGHLPAGTDIWDAAGRAVDAGIYRRAAEAIGVPCPPTDFPPLRLRTGWFALPSAEPRPPPERGRPVAAAGSS